MELKELKIGNYVRIGIKVGTVVAIEEENIRLAIPGEIVTIPFKKESISAIPLSRNLVIQCCGFDDYGRLLFDMDHRLYYLQEHDGHILLLDNKCFPLIHFWEIKTLHQLQNTYALFKASILAVNHKCLIQKIGVLPGN